MHYPKDPTQVPMQCLGAANNAESSELRQLRVGRELMSYRALAVNGDALTGQAVSDDQDLEFAAEVQRESSARSALPCVAVADPKANLANASTATGQHDQVVSHQESLQSGCQSRWSNWSRVNECNPRGEACFKGVRAIALVACVGLVVVVLLKSPMLSLHGFVGTERSLQDDKVLGDAQLLGTVWPVDSGSLLGSTSGKAKSPSAVAGTEAERDCHTAENGEACYEAVSLAMKTGIRNHPDWFPGLNASSSFEEFQEALHRASPGDCQRPCAASRGASASHHGNSKAARVNSGTDTSVMNSKDGPCHTTRKGEACYEGVRWAIKSGIQKHPEWYHGLNKSSSIRQFQDLLHRSGWKRCPRPCAEPGDSKHVQPRNHGHSEHQPSATGSGGGDHEESLSWDDLGGRHQTRGTAAGASEGSVSSTEAASMTTTESAGSSETSTSSITFSTSTASTTAMETGPSVSAEAGSAATSTTVALTTAASDTVAPPASGLPIPVPVPAPTPPTTSRTIPTPQAMEEEDSKAAPILCSFGSPVPEKTPPPVWNLPQAVRDQCWNQMLAAAPRLTRGGQFGRNWCWVGMKEFGCHRHLWAHKTWAEYHDMAVESGATVSTPFEPLKHPALCEQRGLGLIKRRWTELDWARAGLWFQRNVALIVLSLPRSVTRKRVIQARLQQLGIPFNFSWGVDMRDPDALDAAKREGLIPMSYSVDRAQAEADKPENDMGRTGSIVGTVGCAAGHFRAQLRAVTKSPEKPLAVILEDDANPEDDFVPRLWKLVTEELPCDWQAVSLSSRCPYGRCISEHLTRVQPDVNEPEWRCRHGVNYGFQGMLYRTSEIRTMQAQWKPLVFDEQRPHCLDVDVALASISDRVRFYAVPAVQQPGLLTELHEGSSRVDINFAAKRQGKPQAPPPAAVAPVPQPVPVAAPMALAPAVSPAMA